MKYLFHNFINTLRHYKASSLLNIFGMAVAFAAFYVILTQVQWGFTYNHGIEDGDRIFLMTRPNPGKDGELELESEAPSHTGDAAVLAGFCKNFHFRPLQYGSDPFAFYVFGKDHSWRQQGLTHIYVRTTAGADMRKVIAFIRNTTLELCPDIDPDSIALAPFDEELARKYNLEEKLSKQVTAFTLIAIILALMGVFGLVFFETQHRMKEIAVRRVLGAEVKDILSMLSRKYATIVVICFVIAAPVSYLVTERYFSNFAYHMSIQPWVFVAALMVVLVVTVALVVLRSFSAATKNPVESIKAE